MFKEEDVLKRKRAVVDQIVDIFISPRKYMTKIILVLLALSSIDVIASGENSKLFVGYIVLAIICAICLVAIRNSREKRRLLLASAASVAALASFSVFFFMAMTNIGNIWLEEISAKLFLLSGIIMITMIITYRREERMRERNENENKIVMEE